MSNNLVIKTVNISNIKVSGYDGEYILNRIENTGKFYEQDILDKWILPLREKIKIIYDIGANIGNHTLYFALNTNAEKIYSFEPMKINYDILQKNITQNCLNNVTYFNVALGEKKSTAFMEVEKENNNGSAKIVDGCNEGTVEVEVEVLDDFNLPNPDFIKIDVEGFEVSVLNGMTKTLKNTDAYVWIEVDEKNAAEVYKIMKSFGYIVYDMDLKSSNNILFKKQKNEKEEDKLSIFDLLLNESTQRRENWIKIGNEKSKFEYEKKKSLILKEKLEHETSQLEYEQKKSLKLKSELEEKVSQFEYEQRKASNLKIELNNEKESNIELKNELKKSEEKAENYKNLFDKKTSHFLYEQKKANEYRDKFNEVNNKLNMYKKSKLFRLMLFSWQIRTNLKFKTKKNIYRFAHWLYVKLMPYPKLRHLFSGLNNKLNIFKDTNKVITYGLNERKNISGDEKIKKVLKKPSDMNVAMVVDEFTYNSFKYECNPFPVEPSNWREIFEKNDIDLFLCESAWSGTDNERRPWKGQVYCSTNFKNENRGALLEILAYCNNNGIPTVFWNKEDPTHYPDKIHNFVDTAVKFDHVFTTDKGCVEKYKKDYGHKSIHCLMFATQPRLFNPIEKFNRTNEIIFAGSWYNQHPTRCEEMGAILDCIVKSEYPLKIYDRHSETNDPNHFFPDRFKKYLNPCLPHEKMEIAYKSSKYALNINTVTDSDTMFARRVFELMSSNTLVISNYSKGMEELFGKDVEFTDGKSEIKLGDSDRKRERCLYNVLRYHTYKQRFKQILTDSNIAFEEDKDDITLIFNINGIKDAESKHKKFEDIDYADKKGIFYVSDTCSGEELRDIVVKYNKENIAVISQDYCKKYEDILKIDTKYFIVADENTNDMLIDRAMCHFEYIDNNTGIIGVDNIFKFTESESAENIVFDRSMFEKVKENVYGSEKDKFRVYNI